MAGKVDGGRTVRRHDSLTDVDEVWGELRVRIQRVSL